MFSTCKDLKFECKMKGTYFFNVFFIQVVCTTGLEFECF